MSAPKMPGHTCRAIDKLKDRIEAAHKMADDPPETGGEDALRDHLRCIAHELKGEADSLEDLRDANLALRTCAEYWQAEAERRQDEADE